MTVHEGSQPIHAPGLKKDQLITMRDGARIAADIYRPMSEGRFPALLAVSPYGKDLVSVPPHPAFPFRLSGPIEWYVERGYAYIHVDSRGTGKSDGHFRPLGISAQDDLYDLVEWVADQPWCSGKVGMIGASYYGVNQWLAAAQAPPRLACIAPCDAFVDPYRDLCYHGGIPTLFNAWWDFDLKARRLLDYPDRRFKGTAPAAEGLGRRLIESAHGTLGHAGIVAFLKASRLVSATIKPGKMRENTLHIVLDHPSDGPAYWISGSYMRFGHVKTPFYSIGNFASVGLHLRGNLLAFEEIGAPRKLLVNGVRSPHRKTSFFEPPDLHPHTLSFFNHIDLHRELLRWYDYWLKGLQTGIMDDPPVRYWVGQRDEYRTDTSWPPQGVRYQPLYLHRGGQSGVGSLNDGALSFGEPSGDEPPTTIQYPDPGWTGDIGWGTAVLSASGLPDRARRILTFTTAPLEMDLEIAGPICLRLFASSDQEDTDFCVRLCDEPPLTDAELALLTQMDLSRPARVVTRGWLRASHRALDAARSQPYRPWHPHDHPQPLERGHVYAFDIEIWPAAWLFRAGHSIRLELAPGDSPFFDAPFGHRYGIKTGTDSIYHDREHPSHLMLPVLPSP